MKFITLLKKIEANPQLFLGTVRDLTRLSFLIEGYLICEEDNGKTEPMMLFEDFKSYFNSIYGLRSYYSYADILRQESASEEEAFDKFFVLFNQFLEQKKTEGTV